MVIGLDLETTGLNHELDRIIECCLGCYTDDGKLIKNAVMRFNPRKAIDASAQAVHHITLEELFDKPFFEEKAGAISQILSQASMIVIHNAGFDAPFLSNELKRAGVSVPEVPVYDTMTSSRWATPTGKWPKLGELCWALNIEYEPEKAHAAEYDVDVMMRAFFTMSNNGLLTNQNIKLFNHYKPRVK